MPDISIILVNYNEREHLQRTLRALQTEFPGGQAQILVVDNQSTDGSYEMVVQDFSEVVALRPEQNLFYGKGNNFGAARATSDWLLILNPDVAWEPGVLRQMFDWAKTKPAVSIVAPRLQYADGRTQISAHRRFPTLATVFIDYCLPVQQLLMHTGRHPYQLSPDEHQQTKRIAHATGACLLFRREAWRQVGGFDPKFSLYLEETDWQMRATDIGFTVWLYAESVMTHFGSAQKTFAQASRHYLWGLRLYATKHWSVASRLLLAPVVWLAVICSFVTLCVAALPSFVLGSTGQRLRHYLHVYARLIGALVAWPQHSPT